MGFLKLSDQDKQDIYKKTGWIPNKRVPTHAYGVKVGSTNQPDVYEVKPEQLGVNPNRDGSVIYKSRHGYFPYMSKLGQIDETKYKKVSPEEAKDIWGKYQAAILLNNSMQSKIKNLIKIRENLTGIYYKKGYTAEQCGEMVKPIQDIIEETQKKYFELDKKIKTVSKKDIEVLKKQLKESGQLQGNLELGPLLILGVPITIVGVATALMYLGGAAITTMIVYKIYDFLFGKEKESIDTKTLAYLIDAKSKGLITDEQYNATVKTLSEKPSGGGADWESFLKYALIGVGLYVILVPTGIAEKIIGGTTEALTRPKAPSIRKRVIRTPSGQEAEEYVRE